MKTVKRIADIDDLREGTVGLVPTMGAFHEGHLSLMRAARAECDTVVVSLFVNPTQFGPTEDYTRYPRDEEADAAMAEPVGVDVLFAPSTKTMYPRSTTTVKVEGVTTRWEGSHRPGHFDGVATVVCKLLNIVRPHSAYFGLKDFQQCAVVETMVQDLNLPVRLRFCETVREPGGLAMSSRNRNLSDEERAKAPALYQKLVELSETLRASVPTSPSMIDKAICKGVRDLTEVGFAVDYLALVDRRSLEPVRDLADEARLIVAAKLGPVRLIDNVGV